MQQSLFLREWICLKGYESTLEIKPSEQQLSWQEAEFYGSISFGMSTFTGRQPEDGFALPTSFAPEELDTDEWASVAKNAGMRALILTVKDNDGFCLWQTNTTDYSVKKSTWIDGTGDIAAMLSESCRKYSIKFGINICVFDKHEPTFKSGNGYNDLFKNQLRELLTSYGELFEIRIDDTCPQYIPFEFDYAGVFGLIRELQPNAVIAFAGPDVRWVGNNRGFTRKEEWSVVPSMYRRCEDGSIPKGHKKIKDNEMQLDIGSRKAIKKETEFVWYPCEVNALMRDHTYYNKDDNYSVKTKDKLHKLYLNTVGNNSALMLNLSPDKRGHIFDTDKQILTSFGRDLKVMFGYNLLKESKIEVSSELSELYRASNVADDDNEKFWRPSDGDKKPEIIISLNQKDMFDKVSIGEHIANGQHCEQFKIYINDNGKWQLFGKGTTIGYKFIAANKPVETDKIKIVFEKYRGFIEISTIIIN